MSRPCTARIFLEGATRAVKLAEPSVDDIREQYKSGGLVSGVTVDDEAFFTRAERIVDVLGPAPTGVMAHGAIFDGRRVTIRSYAAWRREEDRAWVAAGEDATTAEAWDEYGDDAVVVLGQDLAEAPILVARGNGFALWANPNCPSESIARYRQVVRLACEAETIECDHYSDIGPVLTVAASTGGRESSSYEEIENAKTKLGNRANGMAYLKAGHVAAAVTLLGEDEVAAYLSERWDKQDVVVVDGDALGEIVGFTACESTGKPGDGLFHVDGGDGEAKVALPGVRQVAFS